MGSLYVRWVIITTAIIVLSRREVPACSGPQNSYNPPIVVVNFHFSLCLEQPLFSLPVTLSQTRKFNRSRRCPQALRPS